MLAISPKEKTTLYLPLASVHIHEYFLLPDIPAHKKNAPMPTVRKLLSPWVACSLEIQLYMTSQKLSLRQTHPTTSWRVPHECGKVDIDPDPNRQIGGNRPGITTRNKGGECAALH